MDLRLVAARVLVLVTAPVLAYAVLIATAVAVFFAGWSEPWPGSMARESWVEPWWLKPVTFTPALLVLAGWTWGGWTWAGRQFPTGR